MIALTGFKYLLLSPTCDLVVAKFNFGVESERAKHRSRLGTSFLTLLEETLHTCPKPSPASTDGMTTGY